MRRLNIYILSLSACFLLGCSQDNNPQEVDTLKIKETIDLVNDIFETRIPYDISEMKIYLEGWQAHGLYIFVKIPSAYLDSVKGEGEFWKEVPDEYRSVPRFVEPSVNDFAGDSEKYWFVMEVEAFYRTTRNVFQIYDNNTSRIQWFYYRPASEIISPEQAIEMIITEDKDNFIECYFAYTDVRTSKNNQKLYQMFDSNKLLIFKKED